MAPAVAPGRGDRRRTNTEYHANATPRTGERVGPFGAAARARPGALLSPAHLPARYFFFAPAFAQT